MLFRPILFRLMVCKVVKETACGAPQSKPWPFPMMAESVTGWRVSDQRTRLSRCWVHFASRQAAADPPLL